jgi:predicted HD phosphohydrolase
MHDIGEVLSGTNHGEIPAAILRPYISPQNHWVLANHEVFQAYYFLDKCGGDKDLRDKVAEYKENGFIKGHPFYEACVDFCENYDQPSFDPDYPCDSLESFRPLVEEVLSRQPFWWEKKSGEDMDCKARLAAGYSLKVRDDN